MLLRVSNCADFGGSGASLYISTAAHVAELLNLISQGRKVTEHMLSTVRCISNDTLKPPLGFDLQAQSRQLSSSCPEREADWPGAAAESDQQWLTRTRSLPLSLQRSTLRQTRKRMRRPCWGTVCRSSSQSALFRRVAILLLRCFCMRRYDACGGRQVLKRSMQPAASKAVNLAHCVSAERLCICKPVALCTHVALLR